MFFDPNGREEDNADKEGGRVDREHRPRPKSGDYESRERRPEDVGRSATARAARLLVAIGRCSLPAETGESQAFRRTKETKKGSPRLPLFYNNRL